MEQKLQEILQRIDRKLQAECGRVGEDPLHHPKRQI